MDLRGIKERLPWGWKIEPRSVQSVAGFYTHYITLYRYRKFWRFGLFPYWKWVRVKSVVRTYRNGDAENIKELVEFAHYTEEIESEERDIQEKK